jgi:hypothetical protein
MYKFLFLMLMIFCVLVSATTRTDSLYATKGVKAGSINCKMIDIRDSNAVASISVLQVQDTLQDGSANTGADETIDNNYEAFKITASKNMTVAAVAIQLKRTGTITSIGTQPLVSIYTDNSGAPGTLMTGDNLTPLVSALALSTSYTEKGFYVSSTGVSLVSGTVYWIVIKSLVAPVGGTFQINMSSSAVVAAYAEGSNGTVWTPKDNVTPWFRIYSVTNSVFSGTAYTSSLNMTSKINHGISGSTQGGPDKAGVAGTSTTGGIGVQGTSTTGVGIYGLANGNGGIGGKFTGGTGEGHGITVTKGVFCDSVIITDSVARPTPVSGAVGIIKYFGVDGDTTLCTPKIWMGVTVKGIKYKIPCY